jgi:tetratricopeptide (TPR) repeat protein
MTSIEFLMQEIMGKDFRLTISDNDLNRYQEAVEMHRAEIIKANRDGVDMAVDKKPFIMGEQYYQETFVSNGSDDHISDISKMVEDDVEKLAEIEYPIFDDDLLGIAYNQKQSRIDFIKGYNKAIESLLPQQEISDEEIEKEMLNRYMIPFQDYAWKEACKWYREQLKSKGNGNK